MRRHTYYQQILYGVCGYRCVKRGENQIAVLRQVSDVIMVGEVIDPETAGTAVAPQMTLVSSLEKSTSICVLICD